MGLFAAADRFPKFSPEKTFSELKLYDAAGRPWRTAREDWDGARARIANDPVWKTWLANERAEVDRWMARHRDRVEWIIGWHHDGVSPKDGSKLIWTEQIPGEQAAFLSSRSDPHVDITPKIKAWWVFVFRRTHAEMMVRAAQLHCLTGDDRYAAWTAAQLDFYAGNYQKWEPQPKAHGSRLFWQTLDAATILGRHLHAIRILEGRASAAQRESWRMKYLEPEIKVLNATQQQIHNIATWHRCTAAQFALLYGDKAMWQKAIDGPFGLRAQLEQGVTSDYLWYEQSLGYNDYVVRALLGLFIEAGIAGRAGEFAREMNIAENLVLSPSVLQFPGGLLPNPADSGVLAPFPDREAFVSVYRIFPTPLGLASANGRRTWETLLDPPGAVGEIQPWPPVTSRSLESSRMAVLKSGPWQVFFHYGQLTKSHAQSEALNFSAFFGDVAITRDPGTVYYGSPLYKGYYQRGLCHNALLLNGEGQNPSAPGALLDFSAAPARVSASQPAYRADARARRTLRIEADRLIDTATIETSDATTPQKLGLALHLQGTVRLPATFLTDNEFAAGRPEPFTYWRDVSSAAYREQAVFEADCGSARMRVTIIVPGEFRIWHATSPDVPPGRRESFYIETLGKKATFMTTFEPLKP